jgi:glycine/D-amino acid oxidase-like deaminating enzyme
VTGVKTTDGTLHEADMVVNCAGRWANDAVREAGLHLPLAPTVGFLVFTPPVASGLQRVVRTPVIDTRPDGAGRLILHWNPTDATLSIDRRLSPDMPEARDMVQRARTLLPCIGPVEPEAVRIAIRPIPGDHFSAVGPVPRVRGYYLSITHSAVTMSPFIASVVADELMRNRQREEMVDFRPSRFFN